MVFSKAKRAVYITEKRFFLYFMKTTIITASHYTPLSPVIRGPHHNPLEKHNTVPHCISHYRLHYTGVIISYAQKHELHNA